MAGRATALPLLSDDEIVRRFRETRDNSCFAELFTRHRQRVYFACRGFFPDGALAEDAAQETFLRAYQNMHGFQGGDFSRWLMRIARNVCIDQWRKRRPESRIEDLDAASGEKPGAARLDAYELELAVRKLWEEMKNLSPDQQRCLELKIEGYSYEETVAHTGLSIEAVKSHLQNGRRMLWLKMEGVLVHLK